MGGVCYDRPMSQTTSGTEIEGRERGLHRGAVARWSRTLIPTTREAPADAEMPSHILLTRAGFIRKLSAGVYDYLPLAWRTLRKISDIVREELDAAGASELLLPAMEPLEILKQTGRDEAYGPDLFRLEDRHGRGQALCPTHEEVIVELAKGAINSYKQLPLNLYQIQTKFRDEVRPRSGLLRCREFIMKDAYSFHMDVDGNGGLGETYDAMYQAYSRIFTRCGLDFRVVEAEAGPIGGSASHEFMVNCASGEDTILLCEQSGYAANVEKCETGERAWSFDGDASDELVKHHTPKMPGIDLVAGHLGVTAAQMLKTIVFSARVGDESMFVLAVVRGDHDVNEGKVRDALGGAAAGVSIELADEKAAKAAGFAIGYVSPRMATRPLSGADGELCKVRLVVDPDAAKGDAVWATGADEMDHHVTGFNWKRDLGAAPGDLATVADIRNAMAGDPSPRAAGSTLVESRGIEVGHIFQLGTKYSDAMEFAIPDKEQKRRSVTMGCYGIGVSRTMAACVEMSHDDNGIIWPANLAPYHVEIILMKPDDAEHASIAEGLAGDLSARGIDLLIDDRSERPGVKFKDADLIGLPVRLTIGAKALEAGGVEFKLRSDAGKGEVVPTDDVVAKVVASLGSW